MKKPLVIDAFTFFNEIDMLDLRLHELDSVVDYFVIVDSLEMHGSTNKKTSVLTEHIDVLKPFAHKVFSVTLPQLFPAYTDAASGWLRENYQRNQLLEVAKQHGDRNSVLIVSDCDEIPKASAVRQALPMLSNGICRFEHDFFYYNVNSYVGTWTRNTIGTLAQYTAEGNLQAVREHTLKMEYLHMHKPYGYNKHPYQLIRNAGWHFSYFADIEKMRFKIANFAHSTDPEIRDFLERSPEEARSDIVAHRDIYRRGHMAQFTHRASNDPRLPAYFLSNQERFSMFTEGGQQ